MAFVIGPEAKWSNMYNVEECTVCKLRMRCMHRELMDEMHSQRADKS